MRINLSLRFTLVLVTMTLLIASCATPPGGGTSNYQESAKVAALQDIAVEVDASGIEAERMTSYLHHGGSKVIADAVLRELDRTGQRGPSEPFALKIRVTGYRLRSSASGFWLGAMAGADHLKASVDVVVDERVEKSFETDASTVVAGIVRPGSMNRYQRLANALAERIVAGL